MFAPIHYIGICMDMHEWLASGINIQQSGECLPQSPNGSLEGFLMSSVIPDSLRIQIAALGQVADLAFLLREEIGTLS